MELLGKRVYRTVQLCFKTYSTSVSVNQRVHKVAAADGHVGVASISAPEGPYLTPQTSDHEPGISAAKPFSDIPGKQITLSAIF